MFKLSADILLWSFEKIVPLIAEYGASNNKEDEFDFQVGFICIATRYVTKWQVVIFVRVALE